MPDTTPRQTSTNAGAGWLDPQTRMFEHRARVRPPSYYEPVVHFMPAKIRRLLDVGCGAGTVTLPLAGRAQFAVGIDLSFAGLTLAQERQKEQGKTNMAWVVANSEVLPFAADSFDALVSINVVRLTDMPKTFGEMRRVLSPAGRLAVKDHLRTPQPFGFWAMYVPRILRYIPSWVLHFGVGSMWEMLQYRLSPEGIAETRKSESLTAETLQRFSTDAFPSSRVNTAAGVVLWEKLV